MNGRTLNLNVEDEGENEVRVHEMQMDGNQWMGVRDNIKWGSVWTDKQISWASCGVKCKWVVVIQSSEMIQNEDEG